ncbi:4192_t:CDS:2 [Cetraspora pellucida]|uniref:4192_t:CDS:1 n=1 Tax=Cetraspora pellucida TaxID=1433469 RepID=A0A9N9CF73_9GLOM|nr:4192_t:CDS:2 [Cetraspora pellucida]
MISTENPKYSKDLVCKEALDAWNKIKLKPKNEIKNTIGYLIKDAASTTQYLNLVQYFNTATLTQNKITKKIVVPGAPPSNAAPKYKLMNCIQNLKQVLNNEDKKLQSLKKIANYQYKCKEKKDQDLNKHQQVVKYDSPGHPSVLHKYPDLLEHIHKSIEFSAANSKRIKEVIKVQTVNHLQEALKSKYDKHLSQSTKQNNIFRKPVVTEYIDMKSISVSDNISWEWIEIYTRICKYSLDVKKCNNIKYCSPKRCKEAASYLALNDGFLSS